MTEPVRSGISTGGGGGFQSVPVAATMSQFGDAAMHAGATSPQYSHDIHAALVELIIGNVDADSWEENGGSGTITAVNDTLLVRQNAKNQQKVAEFLKHLHQNTIGGQSLTIELWWLPLDDEGRRNLDKVLAGDNAVATLNELSEAVGGYHGQLKGRNRVMGNFSSGHRVPLIAGRIPVVGTGAIGVQPIVSQVHVGIMAQVMPRLQESWEGDGIQLSLQTEITDMRDLRNSENGDGDIDRYELGRHALAASVICRPATLTIAGSLSAIGLIPDAGQATQELTVVVQVSKSH